MQGDTPGDDMAPQKAAKTWPVEDAKARFSEFLEASLTEGPQIVTRRGVEAAVLVPVDTWRQLEQAARPRLKDLLLADSPRAEIPVPPRRGWRRRTPVAVERATVYLLDTNVISELRRQRPHGAV